jgi:hypothetical protein
LVRLCHPLNVEGRKKLTFPKTLCRQHQATADPPEDDGNYYPSSTEGIKTRTCRPAKDEDWYGFTSPLLWRGVKKLAFPRTLCRRTLPYTCSLRASVPWLLPARTGGGS